MDSDLLTIPEAAAALKVSPVTISRWLKQGRLPAYRMGPRAVRIRREDLTDVLKPSGHADGDVGEPNAAVEPGQDDANGGGAGAGTGIGTRAGNSALRAAFAAPTMSAGERLAALHEAEGLRDRVLSRRKGVQLPSVEPERAKEKRGKRS